MDVQIVGSISAVSSSLLIGKAGPMVHTGVCVAALLGQGGSKKYGLRWKWLRYFKNDRDRRDLVTCGAAAGIAASFRSPVGGLLLISTISIGLTSTLRFNIYQVAVVLGWPESLFIH